MSRTIFLLMIAVGVAGSYGEEPAQETSAPAARLAWFLGNEKQDQIIRALIDQLDADSFVAREAASRELSELPSLPSSARQLASTDERIEVRTRLGRIVKLHPVGQETAELNSILQQIADDEIEGTLERLTRIVAAQVWEPDRTKLGRAARATVTEADLPLLNESLTSQSPSIRLLAAAAFSGLDGDQSSESLRQLSGDADEAVALLAAEALAGREDTKSLATFARLLDSPAFSMRHRSWSALKGLSAQPFDFDPSAEEESRRAAARRWQEWSRSPQARIVGQLPESSTIALFNGQDTNGWTVFENGRAAKAQTSWDVADGTLVSVARGFGDIRTNAAFENYVLTLQYNIEGARGDGGVGVMLTKENENRGVGARGDAGSYLEVQLLPKRAGDLYLIGGFRAEAHGRAIAFSSRRTADIDDPAGNWHQLKLTVGDGAVEVEINGTVVNQASKGSEGPGKIVLRNEGHRISYKDILIHPVDP